MVRIFKWADKWHEGLSSYKEVGTGATLSMHAHISGVRQRIVKSVLEPNTLRLSGHPIGKEENHRVWLLWWSSALIKMPWGLDMPKIDVMTSLRQRRESPTLAHDCNMYAKGRGGAGAGRLTMSGRQSLAGNLWRQSLEASLEVNSRVQSSASWQASSYEKTHLDIPLWIDRYGKIPILMVGLPVPRIAN